jgi:hypothetical protein
MRCLGGQGTNSRDAVFDDLGPLGRRRDGAADGSGAVGDERSRVPDLDDWSLPVVHKIEIPERTRSRTFLSFSRFLPI